MAEITETFAEALKMKVKMSCERHEITPENSNIICKITWDDGKQSVISVNPLGNIGIDAQEKVLEKLEDSVNVKIRKLAGTLSILLR
jgi:hypothetical protein